MSLIILKDSSLRFYQRRIDIHVTSKNCILQHEEKKLKLTQGPGARTGGLIQRGPLYPYDLDTMSGQAARLFIVSL